MCPSQRVLEEFRDGPASSLRIWQLAVDAESSGAEHALIDQFRGGVVHGSALRGLACQAADQRDQSARVGERCLRIQRPDAHRPFRTPLVYVVAPLGILVNMLMMLFLPR